MKVEMKVDLKGLASKHRKNAAMKAIHPEPPRSQAERTLWYIALGHEIEVAIQKGHFTSLADAAKQCHVSRARISRLVDNALNYLH